MSDNERPTVGRITFGPSPAGDQGVIYHTASGTTIPAPEKPVTFSVSGGLAPRHIPNLRTLIDRELEALAADPASDFAEAAAYILLLRREIGTMVAGQRQLLNPRERNPVSAANETEAL